MFIINQLFFNLLLLTSDSSVPVNAGSLLFFGVFIIIAGLVSLIFPQLFWHLRIGRKLPGVPPNRLYLMVLRFGGLLVIILGVVMIFNAR